MEGVVDTGNIGRPMEGQWYFVPRAVYAPTGLTLLAVAAGFFQSWSALAAIPFIWLGSICAAPNCNMADGCLAYLSVAAGSVLAAFNKPLGLAIIAGAISGYCLSVLEKMARMRPADRN